MVFSPIIRAALSGTTAFAVAFVGLVFVNDIAKGLFAVANSNPSFSNSPFVDAA